MAQVTFNYKGNEITIQCNVSDKFKDIFIKFSNKIYKDSNKLIFIHSGKKLDENLSFESQALLDQISINQIYIYAYDIEDYNNNIDVNNLQIELKKILSIYLDDRIYLKNKVDNWKEAIFKEAEKKLLNYKNFKIFIHLTISDKSIKRNNSYRNAGLYSNIDIYFSLEFDSQNINAILNVAMFKKNLKRTKKDLSNVIPLTEKEFLNLAEGREYEIFMEKYYKIFEEKFEKEILSGYKFSLFYFLETSNKYYESSKGFMIINGEKNDYFLSKNIDAGDIKLYIALGKGNSA